MSSLSFASLARNIKHYRSLLNLARKAQATTGKSLLQQLQEFGVLRRYPNKILAPEYFHLGLYEKPLAEARRFIGQSMQVRLDALLNNSTWRALVQDKLVFHFAMTAAGLPVPGIQAAYLCDGRRYQTIPTFERGKDLARFMAEEMTFPCFAKVIYGAHGNGSARLESYDPASQRLTTHEGEGILLSDFLATKPCREGLGYLFQDLLLPHSCLRDLTGPALSGFRIIVAMTQSGPRIVRSVFKVVTAGNVMDHMVNNDLSSTGNLSAILDSDDGTIVKVGRGTGFDLEQMQNHPDSGRPLVGARISEWGAIKDTILTAARHFAGCRLQFWDACLTETGPILLEVNTNGSIAGAQGVFLEGFLTDEFQYFLAEQKLDLESKAVQNLAERLCRARSDAFQMDHLTRAPESLLGSKLAAW